MSNDKQPIQKTPKGKEIPIPTREEFMRNLDKVAPPAKRSPNEAERDGDSPSH